MTVTTGLDLDVLDEAMRIQHTIDQLTPAIEVVSLAEKHAAMFSNPAIDLIASPVFAQHQAFLDSITKPFKFQDDFVKSAFGGLPSELLGVDFKAIVGDLSTSLYGDLFKDSSVVLAQSYFKDCGIGLVDRWFKDSGVGLLQDSFRHLPIGLSEGFLMDSALGVTQGFLSAEITRLLEPINSIVASMTTTRLTDWLPEVHPVLWLGIGVQDDARTDDRSIDAWLCQRRADLRQKHEGMWDAFLNSRDPVLHAATSAVELLLRLFRSSSVSERDVQVWAVGTPHEAAAIDTRQGLARVTWTGRALLAAELAGYDEVGQALIVSLVQSAAILQEMKHKSHCYSADDIEPHLERVEELLSMLAWRL